MSARAPCSRLGAGRESKPGSTSPYVAAQFRRPSRGGRRRHSHHSQRCSAVPTGLRRRARLSCRSIPPEWPAHAFEASRPEVADIFRRHGDTFRAAQGDRLSLDQRKVIAAFEACRRSARGDPFKGRVQGEAFRHVAVDQASPDRPLFGRLRIPKSFGEGVDEDETGRVFAAAERRGFGRNCGRRPRDCGHSYGGLIVRLYASADPARSP